MQFHRTYKTTVVAIQERTRALAARKVGDRWDVPRESLGWFIQMEGSHEQLFVGHDKPDDLEVGDEVSVIIKGRLKHAESVKG